MIYLKKKHVIIKIKLHEWELPKQPLSLKKTAMSLFFENEDVGENYAYTTSEWDLRKMVLTILWFGLLWNIAWTTKFEATYSLLIKTFPVSGSTTL